MSDSIKKRVNRNIKLSVRFKIWAMPCVVCGVPYDIQCDHIIPVSRGGMNDESNIQPLCSACNHAKHNWRSNSELTEWVRVRGEEHFYRAVYREDTRYFGYSDGPTMGEWRRASPIRVAYALSLYQDFLKRNKWFGDVGEK